MLARRGGSSRVWGATGAASPVALLVGSRGSTRVTAASLRPPARRWLSTRPAAIIFDKDGTLIDFDLTWAPRFRASAEAVASLSLRGSECSVSASRLLADGGMDPATEQIAVGSVFHEATAPVLIDVWHQHFTSGRAGPPSKATLQQITEEAWEVSAEQSDVVPLGPAVPSTIAWLAEQGVLLAVVTNDSEAMAQKTLEDMGIAQHFSCVIGHDSGVRAKPEADGILFACQRLGVSPHEVVMVGDSPADMIAGDSAGCGACVAVSPLPHRMLGNRFAAATHCVEHIGQLLPLLPRIKLVPAQHKEDCRWDQLDAWGEREPPLVYLPGVAARPKAVC